MWVRRYNGDATSGMDDLIPRHECDFMFGCMRPLLRQIRTSWMWFCFWTSSNPLHWVHATSIGDSISGSSFPLFGPRLFESSPRLCGGLKLGYVHTHCSQLLDPYSAINLRLSVFPILSKKTAPIAESLYWENKKTPHPDEKTALIWLSHPHEQMNVASKTHKLCPQLAQNIGKMKDYNNKI